MKGYIGLVSCLALSFIIWSVGMLSHAPATVALALVAAVSFGCGVLTGERK